MSSSSIFSPILSLSLAVLGCVLGWMLADARYRRVCLILLHFAARTARKAFLHTIHPIDLRMLAKDEREFSVLSMPAKLKRAEPAALRAAGRFKDHLSRLYGERVLAVYMFGSRAGGAYTFWSDVDVVLFTTSSRLPGLQRQVRWAVLQVMFQDGLFLQPRLADGLALESIETEAHPVIRHAVQTGIPV